MFYLFIFSSFITSNLTFSLYYCNISLPYLSSSLCDNMSTSRYSYKMFIFWVRLNVLLWRREERVEKWSFCFCSCFTLILAFLYLVIHFCNSDALERAWFALVACFRTSLSWAFLYYSDDRLPSSIWFVIFLSFSLYSFDKVSYSKSYLICSFLSFVMFCYSFTNYLYY